MRNQLAHTRHGGRREGGNPSNIVASTGARCAEEPLTHLGSQTCRPLWQTNPAPRILWMDLGISVNWLQGFWQYGGEAHDYYDIMSVALLGGLADVFTVRGELLHSRRRARERSAVRPPLYERELAAGRRGPLEVLLALRPAAKRRFSAIADCVFASR
jgi:hypothetical protein